MIRIRNIQNYNARMDKKTSCHTFSLFARTFFFYAWRSIRGLRFAICSIAWFQIKWPFLSYPARATARLNGKLLSLKKAGAFDITRYYRLKSSVPQPPKLYGLPKLHKPNVRMSPIVSFCGSPTYQLSKYLTTILQPWTYESRHKL